MGSYEEAKKEPQSVKMNRNQMKGQFGATSQSASFLLTETKQGSGVAKSRASTAKSTTSFDSEARRSFCHFYNAEKQANRVRNDDTMSEAESVLVHKTLQQQK